MSFVCLGVSAARAADEPPPAAETRDESAGYRVETVLANLNNPACVVVRPGAEGLGTAELYVSESGAGRVVRVTIDQSATVVPVVTGFPLAEWSDDAAYEIGPLGLAFLSPGFDRLAVGTGGLGEGADMVRVYAIPEGDAALAYDQTEHAVGPMAPASRSPKGEGEFFSLVATAKSLFVAPRRGNEQGWLLRATLEANRLAGLEAFRATRPVTSVPALSAVTVDPRPHHEYLVVGQRGESGGERDSRLSMYSPTTAVAALDLATGLRDIVALAYSPAPSFDLYAADYSLADPGEGGVYRLEAAQVDGRESCRAVKIAAVMRPTGIAFTTDGAMFVTAFGQREPDDDKPAGALLKILPTGDTPKL